MYVTAIESPSCYKLKWKSASAPALGSMNLTSANMSLADADKTDAESIAYIRLNSQAHSCPDAGLNFAMTGRPSTGP
jgi:hypothetical protein